MNNASFHKSQKIRDLVESVLQTNFFPYSSDLNPIEKFCANMKRLLEYNITHFDQFHDAIFFLF